MRYLILIILDSLFSRLTKTVVAYTTKTTLSDEGLDWNMLKRERVDDL